MVLCGVESRISSDVLSVGDAAETAHSLFSSAKSKGKHPIQLSAMVFKTPGFFAFSSTKYPALPKETTI